VRRRKIGRWRCPSGNSVDAYLTPDEGSGLRHLELEWDAPPPLSPDDHAYYEAVILPALVARIAEYTEQRGPGLVVKL
jgi:hypothetical protein